jgi:hypothetical protein
MMEFHLVPHFEECSSGVVTVDCEFLIWELAIRCKAIMLSVTWYTKSCTTISECFKKQFQTY